jgi:ElaB/YqjD/DUF883 family membrane-anchored ribosome-binding protein
MGENDEGQHINGGRRQGYQPAVRAIAQTAERLREADRTLVDLVRERPLASVGVALAMGYIIGRIFSRVG